MSGNRKSVNEKPKWMEPTLVAAVSVEFYTGVRAVREVRDGWIITRRTICNGYGDLLMLHI